MIDCECRGGHGPPRLVAVTGGPGGGKTSLLDVLSRSLCEHVALLPESASLLYSGGFPRRETAPARAAGQRCIFRIQRELEWIVAEEARAGIALCDRGTLDGLAYWQSDEDSFWREMGARREEELARYSAVIHLRTPLAGYNHQNPLRTETGAEALALDRRVELAWAGHPRRHFIAASDDFLTKVTHALEVVRGELPECCRRHPVRVPNGDEEDARVSRSAASCAGPPGERSRHAS